MHYRSVVRIFVIALLQSGLVCGAGFSATGTASIYVTATVEAGCQVAPVVSTAVNSALNPTRLKTPVSVNCTLPVGYQVALDSRRGNDFASDDSEVTGRAENAQAYGRDYFQGQNRLNQSIDGVESGESRFDLSGFPQELVETEHCSADGADSGVITVMIFY